jgi:hypothetical protein
MFQFLEDLENNPNHDIDNEVKLNTMEIQQLKEEVQLNTQILQDIKEIVYQLWKDRSKPIVPNHDIKRQKTTKRPKAEICTITTLSNTYSLSFEESKNTEILAICFGNLFLRQKTNNTCFVVCVYFYWLCCFDWNLINEEFLNTSFELLSHLNIAKNTIPTQELWKPIKKFVNDETYPIHESMWLPDIPQVYDSRYSIGTICQQIYFLDFIRTIDTQNEPITEWCFIYLCVCIFESCVYIRDSARLTLLSIIRTSERIPSYVFDNRVVFYLLKQKLTDSPKDIIVSLFLNILFKLHKYREWCNFFQNYENVVLLLELIPPLTKTKENRKLVKFRSILQKLKKF